MKTKRPLVFGHRGGRTHVPENTMAAFRMCVESGADGIELDVQRCASGELVVIHDHNLAGTTNGVGLVRDVDYATIKTFCAAAKHGPEFASETVPTLKDVLDLVAGKLTINIEIKNVPVDYPGIEDDVLALLSGYAHRDKIIISAFDHALIRRMHAKAPDLKYAVLANALIADLPQYAAGLGATVWHPFVATTRTDSIEAAHAAGLSVNLWTLNTPAEWQAAVDAGVDGIMTDDPAALKAFLDGLESPTE